MQTAGLVLDLYDNPMDLRSIFKSLDEVPETIKTAHRLSSDDLAALPDDSFALVLMNGGDRLRKYACVDRGNTELSIAYFFKHGHKLPFEAQKTAAANLLVACGWYGIDAKDELEKVAGLGLIGTALLAPSLIKGTHSQIKDNLNAVHAAGGVVTPQQQHALGAMMKGAEASGTGLMPYQDPGKLTPSGVSKPGLSNTSAQKTAEEAAAQKHMKPHVSVLGKSAARKPQTKVAQSYAYGNVFPLDNYVQVKRASGYFEENQLRMTPEMRHTFAANLVKRASPLGIRLSVLAQHCGSEAFAPIEQIKVAMDTRHPHITEKQAAVLDALFDHRAELGPDQFCEVLSEFDKHAEIDWLYGRAILDPFESTYGLQKVAEDEGDNWINGNDYITKKQIENYAVTAGNTLQADYGPDFFKEFRRDPWSIFSSLPVEQKRRIARAAGDNASTGTRADVA